MIRLHSSTPIQRAHWASELVAHEGNYGMVSQLSRMASVSRQTLYSWKAKGQRALEAVFTPKESAAASVKTCELARAVLTLLVQGHASYRGIQTCLTELLGVEVSLGTIAAIVQTAGQQAQRWLMQQVPEQGRIVALDEQYSSKRGEAYQSAGGCTQWTSVGDAAARGGRWRELDLGVMVSAGARRHVQGQRQ